ncbi:MAG: discoidin domain-containing protein [Phycisphaerae bacterium]|nr:discoidin domain-containing protein [Phycisphaerae bacterium]
MKKYLVAAMCCLMCLLASGTAYGFDPATDPALIAWWEFNEGEGQTVGDSSGNGHDGTADDGALWVDGIHDGALSLPNVLVEIPAINMTLTEATMAGWIKPTGSQPDWSALIFTRGSATGFNVNGLQLMYHWGDAGGSWGFSSGINIVDGEWNFVALTVAPDKAVFYLDGVAGATNTMAHAAVNWNANIYLGGDGGGTFPARRFGDAALDDVSFYSRALNADEILLLMRGLADPVLAGSPSPANESDDVLRDGTQLTWKSGKHAGTHNVYFGTDMDEVTNATVPTSAGQTANRYDPGRLTFDQTYYWRVDEVNASPDKTVFKGDTWGFTVEPYSIMIPVDVNNVTASSSVAKNPPSMIVNGSGLDGDTHSTNGEAMWLSGSPDLAPWLMFEFDSTQKLDKMLIWNSNSSSEAFIGWSIKDVTIEYSVDGVDWTVLADAMEISRGPGLPTYNTPHMVDFGLAQAKYVKIAILNNWGGLLMQYGVAEVQFYGLPVYARTPEPASGSADIRPDAMATWRSGREADQHIVYVSDDANAVADGTAPSAPSMANSIDLTAFDLKMTSTYYWKVDEVNEAEVPSVWSGPVWSLSTTSKLIVDDFESYGNLSPNRPFQTWTDGYGYSADEFLPEYPGNGTGAGIGHDIWSPSSPQFNGQIMENVSTIQGSAQSMPFYFNNTGSVASQTERTFAVPQDWTLGDVKTLSIAFRGQAGNTGTLYVKINNVKVTYPRDAANIAKAVWQAWNIDLASVNTNLQNVTTLAIGVDGSSASGMILIDDITLHPEAGELITPVQPSESGLILHYTFDAGAGASIVDTSGNGYTATFEILPQYDTGVSGSAASFNGSSNYITAPAAAWSSVSTQFTVSFWAKGHVDLADNWGFYAGDTAGRVVSCHLPWGSEVIFDTTPGWADERVIVGAAPDELRGQWRHWTMVRNTETGEKTIYMDGILYGSTTPAEDPITGVDRFFIGAGDAVASPYMGLIDDFMIYNRALSAEEILWMAGVTTPIDKPF